MKEINFEVFEALSIDNALIFVERYKEAALAVEKKTGLHHVAVLTQAALESGWGLKVAGNNLFGIKWTGKGDKQLITTTEVLWSPNVKFPEVLSVTKRKDGKYTYKVKDWFMKYESPEASFADHADFFVRNPRYKEAWKVRGDYNRFFEEIAKAGYATAPNYADYLKQVAKSVTKRL